MIVNIIMFFTMYPVLLVLYFCFRGQYQYADGCLFAVNMKPEWIKEPEVAAIVEKFRREMKQYFIFLLIVPLSSFLTKYISIQLTIWMMWILLAIVLLCLPLVHANNGLKRWKTEHCLYETEKTEHRIESSRKNQKSKISAIFPAESGGITACTCAGMGKEFQSGFGKNNRIKQYRVAYDHHMAVWTGYDCCSSLDGQTADSGDK